VQNMPRTADLPASVSRAPYIRRALRLLRLSVAFGLASGTVSIATGLRGHSLGVFAVGVGVLADVTGSATLIWRFRGELREPELSGRRERQSALIVGLALAVVAGVLAVEAAAALARGRHPAASAVTITAACLSLLLLTPLAIAKRRLGQRMSSRALLGDAALSGIGAATSFLAIPALMLYQLLGWWWADRITAIIVASVAGTEAWRTIPFSKGG
jgi:divalent metal cation (Fe/Co/Zn/Cd) transporter